MSPNAATLIERPVSASRVAFNLFDEPKRSLHTALKEIFPEEKEEALLRLVRKIMGEAVVELSDRELEVYVTKFQYLIDCWMDEFEKEIFNGLTLKQVIMEV